MELFKNTNFDFLGKKWPFIMASLVLTVLGFGSILMQGGVKLGIVLKAAPQGGKFAEKPDLEKIRSAVNARIKGENTVQEFNDPQARNEVEIGTEMKDEKELNQNRKAMEDVLAATFGQPGSGKLDFNNTSQRTLTDRLRDPLARSGVPMNQEKLEKLVQDLLDYHFRSHRRSTAVVRSG
jgi:preprotein translocase subunit SecF